MQFGNLIFYTTFALSNFYEYYVFLFEKLNNIITADFIKFSLIFYSKQYFKLHSCEMKMSSIEDNELYVE